MKLFQRLLVAPAALGLMAPLAANAAEINLNGVSDYTPSRSEVKRTPNFSDVYPTDWAFTALTKLAERHGCLVSTPATSITRYEAAALLNKCLGKVAQLNEEERLLVNEFGPELAVIKGRVDGLEARVGQFEAGQFSKTTKMSGTAYFVVGSMDKEDDSSYEQEATTFNYTYQLNLKSSFTGKDMLYTRIKTGNFTSDTQFADKSNGTYLSATNTGGNTLSVDKLWYQFPIGDNVQAWVGPRIENYYMLASAPSIYKPVLKQFALGGNGSAYGASTSPGFGFAWTQSVDSRSQPRFAVSTNYAAKNGATSDKDHGIFGEKSVSNWLTKIEYGSPRWQVSASVAFKECPDGSHCWTDSYYSTSQGKSRTGDHSAVGLRGWWKPVDTGLVPAISAGLDLGYVDDDSDYGTQTKETVAWMIGLGWKDAFVDGNKAGIAFGQRQHATDIEDGSDDPADENFVWEAYYTFKVSDNITITPAIFAGEDVYDSSDDDVFGTVVVTQFRF